jgi:hypothetical protein
METRIKTFTKFISDSIEVSEALKYHASNSLSLTESVFRPGSKAHIDLLVEARTLHESKVILLEDTESWLFENTDLGKVAIYEGAEVPLDLPLEIVEINEATKKGKTPKLGKPMRGGPKKYHVYVRNPQTGNIKRIVFGDVHGGLTAKVSNPKARKSFAARHKCKEKKDRLTAGYWACRINRYAHLWGGKTYPGYW